MDYEVFLNFRGKDTRQGFVSCLAHCLEKLHINFFYDDKSIREAGKIPDEIVKAIEIAKIYIPIFSRNYASSNWCLRELQLMVKQEQGKEKKILPIFYDVEPIDVKLKSKLYEEDLERLKQEYGPRKVDEWKNAMTAVARIKGWELKKKSFTECITEIATSVLEMLKQKTTSKHPVRILSEEDQKTFDDLLDIGSGDVRYIGIHGVGGIGKTTLAKSVFKQFSSQFEGCSFLADVGELWKRKSKECLDQLLRDIPDVSEQRTKITERFRGQKVLIVLDNVDTYEQIKNLAGKPFLFGPGSRIIITARDRSVLTIRDKRREILTFEMKEMHPMHALQLFSRHAFGKDSPPDNYCAISSEITNQCRRNPLVLEILGSFLHRKSIDEWEEPRKKLQEMSRTELRGKLMISYEKLNFEAKQIFLDIACFFINKETTKPRYMWESCYFFQKGLESLIYMSFVKIIDNDKLWMHDEVRDLGREMANLREKDDHGREWIFPSRLWEPMKAREIMEKPEGMEEVQALRCDDALRACKSNEFRNPQNLRFLEICGTTLEGDWQHSLLNLRWLCWHNCPENFTATNFNLQSLVILDLMESEIGDQWGGWSNIKVMTNLKVLDLTNCKNLTATPDLSSNTKLERLILEGCNRLATIHKSIGALECLTHLNAKGCNLSEIPVELCSLTALTEIRITREDKGSLELPESFGNLKSLLILEISGVTMTRLPCSIEKLTNLERLYLCDSHVKKRLPNPIGKLISLTELDISKAVVELPDNIGNLKRLKALKMNDCTIRGLPTSIVEAEQLEVLLAEGCTNLKGLAENIHKLSRLKLLDVSGSKICRLPKRISALSHLQTLLLASTEKIRRLPKLPTSLTSLRIKPLEEVPDLSELKNLTDLVIGGVADGESTPIRQTHDLLWMGKLSKLRCLELYFPNATTKLPNFGGLTRLVSLNLTCLNIEGSWQLPSGLSMLILNLKMTLPNLSTSKNLSILRCYNCSINDDSFSSLPGSELRLLKHFLAEKCNISTERGLCLPKDLAILSIAECQFQKRKSINLSGLSSLKRLKLSHCKALSVVRGLGDLKSLQELIVEDCKSLKKLENSSDWTDLKSLEVLHALRCKNLVTRELDRLDFPKHKVISGCKSD